MNTSVTVVPIEQPESETWRKFYNGPHAGLIDVEAATKEMPWLIGMGRAATVDTNNRAVVCRHDLPDAT